MRTPPPYAWSKPLAGGALYPFGHRPLAHHTESPPRQAGSLPDSPIGFDDTRAPPDGLKGMRPTDCISHPLLVSFHPSPSVRKTEFSSHIARPTRTDVNLGDVDPRRSAGDPAAFPQRGGARRLLRVDLVASRVFRGSVAAPSRGIHATDGVGYARSAAALGRRSRARTRRLRRARPRRNGWGSQASSALFDDSTFCHVMGRLVQEWAQRVLLAPVDAVFDRHHRAMCAGAPERRMYVPPRAREI